jgi:hypothetical protein
MTPGRCIDGGRRCRPVTEIFMGEIRRSSAQFNPQMVTVRIMRRRTSSMGENNGQGMMGKPGPRAPLIDDGKAGAVAACRSR